MLRKSFLAVHLFLINPRKMYFFFYKYLILIPIFKWVLFLYRHCILGPNLNRKAVNQHPNPLAPRPAQTFDNLQEVIIQMLLCLGSSLHYDSVLLSE